MSARSFFTRSFIIFSLIIFIITLIAAGRIDFVSEAGRNKPEPSALLTTITASNNDALFTDSDADGRADPGETIEYTATITNTGAENATGVIFSDTLSGDLSLVGSSVNTSPLALNDSYPVYGNVSITIPDGGTDVLANDFDPDNGLGSGLTLTTTGALSSTNCAGCSNVTLNANGSFTYDPPVGFVGADTFSYTVRDNGADGVGGNADDATTTGTVTLNISGMIWFINPGAAACTTLANQCGKLSKPFSTLEAFRLVNGGGGVSPVANQNIFIYQSAAASTLTATLSLLSGQVLIGQDSAPNTTAIDSLTLFNITLPTGSATLPNTDTGGNTVTITGAGLTVVSGNTVRGLAINNTAANTKLNGSGFGTLTLGNLTLSGTGKALNLTTGTLATHTSATEQFASIASTSSPTHGINLSAVGGTLSVTGTTTISGATSQGINIAGSSVAANFGTSTSVGATLQGIVVGTSNGNISFGNTTLTPGSDGVSLQGNSAGTKSFGTLTVTNGTGKSFVHSAAGGATTVTGAATFTNPGGNCIDIQDSTTAITFANVNCTQSGGTGVFLDDNTGNMTFADLDITPDSGQRGLQATTGNTGTITTTSGTMSTTNGTAIDIVGTSAASTTPINMTLTSVTVSGSATGIILQNTSGTGFTIVGSGTTDASGGTISNISGADGSTSAGIGIYLNNVANITLINMDLTGTFSNFGIRGDNVNNFTLRDCNVTGASGDNIALDEATIRFGTDSVTTGIKGTALFEGNTIGGGREDNLSIFVVGSDTLNVTVKDNTVSGSQAIFNANHSVDGNDALHIGSGGTSNVTVMVDGVTFTSARGDLLQITSVGSTVQNSTVQNNTFTNAHPAISQGGGGMNITGSGGSSAFNVFYRIHNNTFKGSRGAPIFCSFNGSAGTINGVITNNSVGTPNGVVDTSQANRGAVDGIGFFGGIDSKFPGTGILNYALRLEGNTFRDLGATAGILLRSATQDAQGVGRFEATIKNNTLAEVVNVAGGIYAQACGLGGSDSGKMGLDISGNTLNVSSSSGPADAVFIDQSSASCQNYFPGYAGPTNPFNQLSTYLTGKGNTWTLPAAGNSGTGGAVVNGNISGGNLILTVPSLAEPGEKGFANSNNNSVNDLSFSNPSYKTTAEMLASMEPYVKKSAPSKRLSDKVIGPVSTEFVPPDDAEGEMEDIRYWEIVSTFISETLDKLSSAITPMVTAQEAENVVPQTGELVCVDGDADIDVGTCTGPGITLGAGKSVTIKFRATIRSGSPYLTQVSNQGTVSGSNFSSPVLTDDPSPAGSADSTVTIVDSTAITVSSSQNPSITGQSITFTATLVGAPVHATGDPGGTVEFFDGTTSLGTATVAAGAINDNAGTATITTSVLTAGSHNITADFLGGGTGPGGFNANDVSNTLVQTISNTAIWDGSTSTAWADGTNWTTNGPPSLATNDVLLPNAGVTFQPTISAADVTVNDITINAGRSLTLNSNRAFNVNGTLTMNGLNILGGNAGTVVIGSAGTVTRTAGAIETNLRKDYATASGKTFEVGTANGYSPATINATAGTFPLSFTVRATQGGHPNVVPANKLQRYWTVTPSGGSPTASLTFNYFQTDVVGTETNYRVIRVTGGTPVSLPNVPSVVIDTVNNTFSINGITSFSDWTLGELAPTGGLVTVGGRVVSAGGPAVSNAQISMVGSGGYVRTARTNPFGYYRFTEVTVGETYAITIRHKLYKFSPRILFVDNDMDTVDFVADP